LAAFVETLAPTRCNHDATDAGMRNPITGISGCCARAAGGHAAAPPSSVMNSRRRRRSFEVDRQLKFRGLLDRQISRFCAF
jgi:hypothetical protein